MTTYAAAIAARLQGREDEDMGKGPSKAELTEGFARAIEGESPGPSVWDDEVLASKVAEVVHATVVEALAGLRTVAPLHELADADQVITDLRHELDEVTADRDRARALNLEKIQEVGTVKGERDAALMRVDELERELVKLNERNHDLVAQLAAVDDDVNRVHGACYVTREVPWTDVAAGMMTIARDGTPWMVGGWNAACSTVVLVCGAEGFEKTPHSGETVRVLVPYVTPEQAEGLVRDVLGGTEA
jgi:hypothetical protein